MRLPDLGGFLPVRGLDDIFQSEGAVFARQVQRRFA
jgi:hypothetical protein